MTGTEKHAIREEIKMYLSIYKDDEIFLKELRNWLRDFLKRQTEKPLQKKKAQK